MESLLHRVEEVLLRIRPLIRQHGIVPVELQAEHVHVEELFIGRHAGGWLDEPGTGSAFQFARRQVDRATRPELPATVLAVHGRLDELERALELDVLRIVRVRHVGGREVNFQLATRRRVNNWEGGVGCSAIDGGVAHAAPEEGNRVVPRTFKYLQMMSKV